MGLTGDSVPGVVGGGGFTLYAFLFTWGISIPVCPVFIRRTTKTQLMNPLMLPNCTQPLVRRIAILGHFSSGILGMGGIKGPF